MTTDSTPSELADQLLSLLDRAIVCFDVDGVLSPIVEHAENAALLPGIHDALQSLTKRTEVAILSGRSLDSLQRLFAFPSEVHVIGSHGLERRGAGPMDLDRTETARFRVLEQIGRRAVTSAGNGAWLEQKPASVAVHTRSADPATARPAVDRARQEAGAVEGAVVKGGHEVLELLTRSASKGEALLDLAHRLARSPVIFLGDDLTDEDAFRLMGDDDVSIRVGGGETAARHRLPGPEAVRELIDLLVNG
jgi:trehalose 6-phosphate phosphatase